MKIVLEQERYTVVEATNGEVAVDVAEREQPDVILMDMSMPLMDGCKATKLIRQLPGLRTTPIIAFTAYNRWDWKARAIVAGCTDFLTKPIQVELLLKMLTQYLP
jgi:CheY-like chemotaxis protein